MVRTKFNLFSTKQKVKYKDIIIFDFDGVIVDSFHVAYEVAQMRREFHLCIRDYQEFFEGNIALRKNKEKLKELDIDKEIFKRVDNYRIREGAKEVIEKLSRRHKLVIVTSTSDYIINYFLKKHNLFHFFEEILDVKVAKSKIEKFNMLFNKYKTEPNNCLFVTDTLGDLIEANKVNLPSVAIMDGFHTYETLKKGNPITIMKTLDEIFKYSVEIKNVNRR